MSPGDPATDTPRPFTWGPPSVTPTRLLTSIALLGLCALAWCFGVVQIARWHLACEALLVLALPVLLLWGRADIAPRIRQLIWFESGYNVLALANQGALIADAPGLAAAVGWGFGLFFAVQIGGFLAFEWRSRRWAGLLASLLLATLLGLWALQIPAIGGAMHADGRFLMWGEDAALALRIGYAVWAVSAVFGDLDDVYLRELVLHGASIAIAFGSGEFWHARLLTASHIFVVDTAFRFSALPSPTLPADFVHLPVATRRWLHTRARPVIDGLVVLGLVGLLIGALTLGLDLDGGR